VLPIFQLIQRVGNIATEEMARTFNLGLGMLLIVSAEQLGQALSVLGEQAWAVGEIVPDGYGPPVQIK
jgi:phosphoribosylformylglycinamidine cyclo-ligase